jgi:hypothetical protein
VAGFYEQAARLNPYMAEPHLMLAQLHVQAGRWQEGEQEARQALQLFLDWGTQYDKVGLLVTGRGRVLVSSVCDQGQEVVAVWQNDSPPISSMHSWDYAYGGRDMWKYGQG